jgi:hypothetical protein
VSAPPRLASSGLIPELGPALGRLCNRAHPASGRWVGLDDIRLDLATRIFELAGAARAFALADDRAAAVSSLNRQAWLTEWERAVGATTERITRAVNLRFDSAGREARLRAARRTELLLAEPDRLAISGRLGAGSLPFLHALDELEQVVPSASASGARGDAAVAEWQEKLLSAARRLESAWLALEAAAQREESLWSPEIARVRSWRRPTWPLWLVTGLVLAVVTYLGLILGGYLLVPAPLLPLAHEVWARF